MRRAHRRHPQPLAGAVVHHAARDEADAAAVRRDYADNLRLFGQRHQHDPHRLPSVQYATHTLSLHAYDFGIVRYEMGYASAVSVVLFILILFTYKLFNFPAQPAWLLSGRNHARKVTICREFDDKSTACPRRLRALLRAPNGSARSLGGSLCAGRAAGHHGVLWCCRWCMPWSARSRPPEEFFIFPPRFYVVNPTLDNFSSSAGSDRQSVGAVYPLSVQQRVCQYHRNARARAAVLDGGVRCCASTGSKAGRCC